MREWEMWGRIWLDKEGLGNKKGLRISEDERKRIFVCDDGWLDGLGLDRC